MLQIRLLGQFDLRLDGKRVTIPTRVAQSLLAYLTLTAGTAHRREKLAGIFWPDSTDEIARKNLRQELWRIRKGIAVLGSTESDYLIADEITLKFNREAKYWLDVAQMERPDHDLQSLIANLSLYQGELLPGFYDEWITLERERIQVVFDARVEQLLEQLTMAERWIAVQEWGERWLALSSAREPAYRALMLASGARGDMAKVASLYQRCTEELMEYLGVEPSAETRALHDGLLKGTKVPARAPAQPSGTITFLFTDIEGSTQLLERLGDRYAVALSEHHEILRAAIQKWNGREMDTQGDAFFVTFTRALDAVQCAAEAQRALTSHSWHQDEALRVRMGLHTGEPLISSTGYVGMDMHRAARIGDAGHGGQILLSQTTRELVVQDLPQGMTILDLGEHRLKDMKYPASIYQLVIDGLPADFAPIRTKFTGAESPTPGEAPFKGLRFFDVDDSDLFFGRETLTAKLVHRLHDANFLSVIIGASGSGKSSLVRAGVVPAIKKRHVPINGKGPPDGSANWRVHVLTPTAHPLETLAIELTRNSESVTAAATLMDDLSKDPRSLHFFLSRQVQAGASSHTLLVIDQFEELFTLCRDHFEREAFIDNLLFALTPILLPLGEEGKGEGNITLIITLRADFYAHLAQYPELRDAVAREQEYIGPMTSEELRRAIEEPARRGHWEFEPGLVDLILRDVGDEPGALPLLSHALLETWKRRAGHILTLKGYAEAGGVRGAIAHTAESVFQSFSPGERTIMRNILLRLTEFGEGTEDTRRRAAFDELMSSAENADERSEVRTVLHKLAEARLVTLSEDTAEVAHEALIREWPQLREWLSQDREGIILHRHLTEAAQEWELLERDVGSLYRGARLAQANEWSALNPSALNAQEQLFLEASNSQMRREEQEREEQRQRELEAAKELAETQRRSTSRLRIRNRVITTVASIAVILALLAGVFGVRAETEKKVAISRELAIAAVNNLEVDPQRSILLALQAVSVTRDADKSVLPEAESALHRAVQASRVLRIIHAHTDMIYGLDISRDGKRLASGSDDGTAKIWDAVSGEELLTLNSQSGEVTNVVFSPDGALLATAGSDGRARVWDSQNGKELLTLAGHDAPIHGIAFSPDGMRIVTAGADGIAIVWQTATGKQLLTLRGHNDAIWKVVYNPDGTRLLTGSLDQTAKVWDAKDGKELLTLSGHTWNVETVAFSPDGKQILTGSTDITAKLWDASSGAELLTFAGHDRAVYGGAFSPDGMHIATVSDDGTAKVWDSVTGHTQVTLSGHLGAVTRVRFTPDGNRLVTSGIDGTLRIWDLSPERDAELFALPGQYSREDTWFAFNGDWTRIAENDTDGTIRIWDVHSNKELVTIPHTDEWHVWMVGFSPDEKRLITSGAQNLAKVWDAESGELLLTLTGHGEASMMSWMFSGVMDAAFIPDGSRIATVGIDQTVRIWDAATGRQLLIMEGHTGGIVALALSPDGTKVATASDDKTVRIWDVDTGNELLVLQGFAGTVWDLAYSPDGTRLATVGFGGTAKVWNAKTGKELFNLSGHVGDVVAVAFSPDGSRLVTADYDDTVRVWDMNSGQAQLDIPGRWQVAFSPDGTRLATGGSNYLRIYLLQIEELVVLARSRLTRSWTTEECRTYLHVEECPQMP